MLTEITSSVGLPLLFAADQAHDVPGWMTGLFALILVGMIAALALEEKIHAKKSIIVGTFAGISLILATVLGMLRFGDVTLPDGHTIGLPVYIPSIDWGVITIILGASLFVEVTSRSGVFTWMAITLTRKSGGDPWRLLIFYGLLTVLFSAVLNNVTAMIIIGSLTTVSLKKLHKTELMLGFLLTEGLLTNVGGLLTLISSVPNIIVGKAANISFGKFFVVAAPYVAVATIVTLLMAKFIFGIKGLKTPEEKEEARRMVDSFDPNESIPSDRFFWFSVGALAFFIICLAGQSALPFGLAQLEMGFVALFFAGVVLIAYKNEVDKFYAAVDWDLLAFFASLFVVIHVMEHAQVLAMIGGGISALLQLPDGVNSSVLLASSAVASSVTDNIPLAAMLAQILGALETPEASPFWWCVIFGANLGGNITPIGSASTVVAMTIIQRQKLNLTFTGFVKAAVPFAVVQIVIATVYVLIAVPSTEPTEPQGEESASVPTPAMAEVLADIELGDTGVKLKTVEGTFAGPVDDRVVDRISATYPLDPDYVRCMRDCDGAMLVDTSVPVEEEEYAVELFLSLLDDESVLNGPAQHHFESPDQDRRVIESVEFLLDGAGQTSSALFANLVPFASTQADICLDRGYVDLFCFDYRDKESPAPVVLWHSDKAMDEFFRWDDLSSEEAFDDDGNQIGVRYDAFLTPVADSFQDFAEKLVVRS